jgi:superfamily II DNA/RNA helicase
VLREIGRPACQYRCVQNPSGGQKRRRVIADSDDDERDDSDPPFVALSANAANAARGAFAAGAELWGIQEPTSFQTELGEAFLSGSDCVGIAPTNAGKSLTYIAPALGRASHGLVLVISR